MSWAVLLALLPQQPGGPYDPDPKLETVVSIRGKARAILSPTTLADETFRTGRWTRDRYSFGLLKALWPE